MAQKPQGAHCHGNITSKLWKWWKPRYEMPKVAGSFNSQNWGLSQQIWGFLSRPDKTKSRPGIGSFMSKYWTSLISIFYRRVCLFTLLSFWASWQTELILLKTHSLSNDSGISERWAKSRNVGPGMRKECRALTVPTCHVFQDSIASSSACAALISLQDIQNGNCETGNKYSLRYIGYVTQLSLLLSLLHLEATWLEVIPQQQQVFPRVVEVYPGPNNAGYPNVIHHEWLWLVPQEGVEHGKGIKELVLAKLVI